MSEILFDNDSFDSYEDFTKLNEQMMESSDVITSPSILITTTLNEFMANNSVQIEPSISYIPGIGPKRDSLYVAIPLTIIYSIIFLTGIVGNVSTCIVIGRNKSMHTATNYYLFSLAVSDLLLLVTGLPQEVYMVWSRYPYIFGEVFCVVRGLAAETSAYATVLTITAFTVERYVAICHPFLSHTMSKLSRAIKLILIIWLTSFTAAMPVALQFGVTTEHYSMPLCLQTRVIIKHNFEISTFLFFVTPMTLITVLYILIGLRLRHSNMMKKESNTTHTTTSYSSSAASTSITARSGSNSCKHQSQSSRRVLKMLVAVVVAFFVCWAPFHIQRLVAIYVRSDNEDVDMSTDSDDQKQPELKIYEIVTHISGMLYYVSTTTNPLLYHIMSNKFRNAFKETFSRCCGGVTGNSGRRRVQRSYSALSQRAPEGGMRGLRCGNIANETSTDCSGNSANSAGVQPLYSTKQSSILSHQPTGPTSTSVTSIHTSCVNSLVSNDTQSLNRTRNNSIRITMIPSNETGQHTLRILPKSGIIVGVTQPRTSHKILRFFQCIVQRHTADERICYMPPLEVETTPLEMKQRNSFSISPCHISNSSLRDIDNGALEDELTIYMQEIQRRDRENFYLNR